MKTADFIREHHACRAGAKWAMSISDDMAEVWDALVNRGIHAWLLWTATRPVLFPDSTLRHLACRCVRETPLRDGRMVFDLLTDERSRNAIEVAQRYADGKATEAELAAAGESARDAARAAAEATYSDAYAAADAAAWAAYDAADADAEADRAVADAARAAAARVAAKSAQVEMIAALGNPFKGEPARD